MILFDIVFFLALIIILFSGTRGDNRRSGAFKLVMSITFGFFILTFFIGSGLGTFAIVGIVIYLIVRSKKKLHEAEMRKKYGWDPQRWDNEQGNQRTMFGEKQNNVDFSLPKSVSKRKKIVENFNEKYHLCLTVQQIQGIADSSYLSGTWRNEVVAMKQRYETVSQWFQGSTNWLRVYMYVFHVQEITSDIRQQENICMYAFEEVFRYADLFPDESISGKIHQINDKFFTSFDDVSFMLAYRFLESKGLRHELGAQTIVRDDETLDELAKKYQTR